jgi:hypothetical protein
VSQELHVSFYTDLLSNNKYLIFSFKTEKDIFDLPLIIGEMTNPPFLSGIIDKKDAKALIKFLDTFVENKIDP